MPIVLVYVSPASVRRWGDDVLGRPQPAERSARAHHPGRTDAHRLPASWDIKFVYGGGTSAVSRFNLCNGGPVIAPR